MTKCNYLARFLSSLQIQNCALLTFGRAIDDIVLLGGMLQDTLRAEHLFIILAIELHFFGWMLLAELQGSSMGMGLHTICLIIGSCSHRQTSQNLVVHREIVYRDLMASFVVGTLDGPLLRQLFHTL